MTTTRRATRAALVLTMIACARLALAQFPAHTGLVTDAAGMLPHAARTALEAKLRAYQDRTTNVIAVAIVPTMGDMDVKEYANKLFHTWGIGDKAKDNGVLLLWAPKERKIRIEVGYGLEPALPDGRAGEITRTTIAPHFTKAEWTEGLDAGVDAIIAQLDRQPAEAPVQTPNPGSSALVFWILGFVFVVAVIGAALWLRHRQRQEEEEEELARMVAAANRAPVFPDRFRPNPDRFRAGYTRPVRPVVVSRDESRPSRRETETSASSPSSSWSSDWGSSSSSSSSSSDSGFGGGDSGGGGGDSSY